MNIQKKTSQQSPNIRNVIIKHKKGETEVLSIKKFSFDQFVPNPAIVMIAKRGSGKSFVLRAILFHYRHIPAGLIICPTDSESGFYEKFYPDSYIRYEYNPEHIKKLFIRQMALKNKNVKRESEGKKPVDRRCILVMDDCMASAKSWQNDQGIKDVFANGRHYEIMYIFTMQYPKGIHPELRSNFDYFFLLADDTVANIKKLYDNYAGMFASVDVFKQVFDQLTADYGCMVVVNRGARNALTDKIFWYVAPNLDNAPAPKFGCKQFRGFHKMNYNPEWRAMRQELEINLYNKMRKR